MFPKIGVVFPQNGWFTMENPMNKWMILGGNSPYFWTHPHHVYQLTVPKISEDSEVPNARVKEGRFITVAPESWKFHHFSPVPNWPFFSWSLQSSHRIHCCQWFFAQQKHISISLHTSTWIKRIISGDGFQRWLVAYWWSYGTWNLA